MPEMFERDDGRSFGGSPADFKNRCYTFLVVLCNDKDFDKVRQYLDPECVLIHEDNPPLKGPDAFVTTWQKTLEKMPNYHKNIRDMMHEPDPERPGAARIWIYSQITGITDTVRDSVDMMHFTAEGRFLDSKDIQRDTKGRS